MSRIICKRLKPALSALLFLCFMQATAGDRIFYRPISNITFTEKSPKTLTIGVNFEFTPINFKAAWNIDEKVFMFGTFNFDKTKAYRSNKKFETNNSGFSLGAGAMNMKREGYFTDYEIMGGIQQQRINYKTLYRKQDDKNHDELNTIYVKPFAQLNLYRVTRKYQMVFSTRLSFLYFFGYEYVTGNYYRNVNRSFQGKGLPFLDPTMTFTFSDLPLKKLMLNAQAGFSIPLLKLKHDVKSVNFRSRKDYWPLRFLFTVSVEYSFGHGGE
jgi:hypothetical protein